MESGSEARNSGRRSSAGRQYAISGIVTLVLAFAVYVVAKPEEVKGPPQTEKQQAGLPNNHPDVDSPAMREAGVQQLAQQVEIFRAENARRPDDPLTILGLANALYDLAQANGDVTTFDEASGLYERYLATHEDDPNARTDYAYTLYKTGNVDRAIDELRQVRAAHPDHQHSAFNLGIMFKEKDLPDSVLAYMRITAEIDPTTQAGKAASEVLRAYNESH
jgi:tetratricopeptide (TPR) repeat protein